LLFVLTETYPPGGSFKVRLMAVRFATALLIALLLVPAGARASTTFGADPGQMPDASPPGGTDASLASPTAPFTGVLVRWSLRTETSGVGAQPAVYRGAALTAVALDAATTTAIPLTTAGVRLPMRAGDRLGVHGTGGSLPRSDVGGTLLVSGILEADADNDGYGDETQDACPAEASLHIAPCTADIALTMSGPAFGVVDRDTPYVVTVANHGPSAATGVTLTDVIPSGARFMRTEGPGTCTPGATVRCTLPAIASGASSAVTIVLAGTAEGASFRHAVSVTATNTDPTPADHGASVDTLVTGASVPPAPITLAGAACANPSFGGRDDDVLFGSSFGDRLFGRQGRDLLRGRAGNDCLYGGEGADVLDGDGGDDSLWGGDGRDRLFGGTGNDRLLGGAKGDELHGDAGNDQLFPGTGRDRVWGGPGNDTISARDGSRDVIACGTGLDRVTADARDHLRGCERVSRR
jgi:Ca2+-binding RTX toxin-like protein